MTWLKRYTSRTALLVLIPALLAGCAAGTPPPSLRTGEGGEPAYRIAVLPVHNLSGKAIPNRDIRQLLCDELDARGFRVWNDETFDRFLLGNRIRYTGGLDAPTAAVFAREQKARAVLVTTVEMYEVGEAPRIALTSRLIDVEGKPRIIWIDSVALTGYDSPGILELGKIRDITILRKNAVAALGSSLDLQLQQGGEEKLPPSGKHKAKILHRKESLKEIAAGKSIIVLPFVNFSQRKQAGDIMQLYLVRQLIAAGFDVMEPGVVRDELLRRRIIFDKGISVPQADILLNSTNADFIMGGIVQAFEESSGESGKPQIGFSAYAIAPEGNRMLWTASFRNNGDEGVYFFDWGRVLTASELLTSMTASAVNSFIHN